MSKKIRGFEWISTYETPSDPLPQRATEASAGYDISASETITIPSIWKSLAADRKEDEDVSKNHAASTLVPTGLKAYMPASEVLLLVNRSSNAMKNQLALPNGIGVIDADYYNNEKNEGEIFVQLINYGFSDYTIKKGDRIAQGIFTKYYTADDEKAPQAKRTGGFGSSGI